MCSGESLLDLENKECVVYLLSGQGPALLSPAILKDLSTGEKPAVHPGAHLAPTSWFLKSGGGTERKLDFELSNSVLKL